MLTMNDEERKIRIVAVSASAPPDPSYYRWVDCATAGVIPNDVFCRTILNEYPAPSERHLQPYVCVLPDGEPLPGAGYLIDEGAGVRWKVLGAHPAVECFIDGEGVVERDLVVLRPFWPDEDGNDSDEPNGDA